MKVEVGQPPGACGRNGGDWRQEGIANVRGIASLPQRRLERRPGLLPKEVMDQIKSALGFALES